MKKSLLILSGGMDSVTLLYEYKKNISRTLSFRYGWSHNGNEIPLAKYHSSLLGIPHYEISVPGIGDLFSSSLLEKDKGEYTEHPTGFKYGSLVPFRNGIMVSLAIGLAESFDLSSVYLGVLGDDCYPDCTAEFISAMDKASQKGTVKGIRVLAPYLGLTKREVALKGKQLGVDYTKTWTCYIGGETHCGECKSCLDRKTALRGFDETEYLK